MRACHPCRQLAFEALEERQLLSASSLSASDLATVPLWDGERRDPAGRMENYFGGGPMQGIHATVEYTGEVVHSGQGAYVIRTNGAIAAGGFDFAGTSLTGFGPSSSYVDTRDLTHYAALSFYVSNRTTADFDLALEIKDYLNSNGQKAQWTVAVPKTDGWQQITVPLDLGQPGWQVTPTPPDLTRAKLLSFVILADHGSAVDGSIYLDDMTLHEPGGPVDPAQTPTAALAARLARRDFDALWGARDRDTGFLPANSAYGDIVATNVTAGLVKSLPVAIEQGWITRAAADAAVASLVQSLNRVMDHAVYLPPRYLDRVTLEAAYVPEESTVDAAMMYLALYQYEWLPATSVPLRAEIGQVLARFNFAPLATAQGWRLAYDYSTASLSPGTYDGYSGEVWIISLAAHLAGQMDITALYNSGVNRTAVPTLDSSATYLVHSLDEYRAPFVQWLFPLFVDVSGRGPDSYPVPALASNPWDNAVRYQADVDARLAAEGRGTLLQPDAGNDWTGLAENYQQYSVFDAFGRPSLTMPWSVAFALLGDPGAGGPALTQMLVSGLHGPFGLVDSAYWDTGWSQARDVASRYDLWNSVLSLIAFDQYLYHDNRFLASLPAVASALDKVFQHQPAASPAERFVAESANLYSTSASGGDMGQAIVPLYTDYHAGGDYTNIDSAVRVTLDGNDPDAGRGTSSFRVTWDGTGENGYFQFGFGMVGPRDIPDFGSAETVRFLAEGDAAGQEVRVNVFRTAPGGGYELLASSVLTLSTTWQEFAVDLPAGIKPADLHAVQFVLGDGLNPGNRTFRLDDVRVDTGGYDPLRVVQSYRPGGWAPSDSPVGSEPWRDMSLYPNRSYLYDNALAIKALWASENAANRAIAPQIANAILATALPDGSYYNVRNSGHVLDATGAARAPFSLLQTLGDNAWFGLALMDLFRGTGDLEYLSHARQISDWAEARLKDTGALKGYRGGFDESGAAVAWRSTEHNIDLFALNTYLAAELAARNDPAATTYAQRAQHAGDFVMAMFDPAEGKFWTGTSVGDTINQASIPLDAQLWACLAMRSAPRYAGAIDWSRPLDWAEAHLGTSDGPYSGFTFSTQTTPASVWFEGTAQAAVLYAALGDTANYAAQLRNVEYARINVPAGDGRGVVAVSRTAQDAALGALYDPRLHEGATAWLVLAEKKINPLIPSPVWTIDDGDPGFAATGVWTIRSGAGFQADARESAKGSGRDTATWTLAASPGYYRIAATWPLASKPASNAPFAVYDGKTLLRTIPLNQKSAPNDFSDEGASWEWLNSTAANGAFRVSSGQLVVKLTDRANGTVTADAIRVERLPDVPEVHVLDGAAALGNGATVRFGPAWPGMPVTKTITVKNQGLADLVLSPLEPSAIPAGFELVSNLGATTVGSGQSTSFTVRLTAAAAGAYRGSIALKGNDPATGSFELVLDGIVSAVRVIDDGDAGFGTTGAWTARSGPGFQADARENAKGSGRDKATWTFAVTPGSYRVAITWPAGVAASAASNAPFAVYDGSRLLGTVLVDQTSAPTGLVDLGAEWKLLDFGGNGGVFRVSGKTLVVRLTDKANGTVLADAVRIERIADPPQVAAARQSLLKKAGAFFVLPFWRHAGPDAAAQDRQGDGQLVP